MSGLKAQSLIAALVAAGGLGTGLVRAGVVFDNCITAADGSLSCDTRPTGNTVLDDEAARYGLFDQASPGWAEYSPEQGFNQMLGG